MVYSMYLVFHKTSLEIYIIEILTLISYTYKIKILCHLTQFIIMHRPVYFVIRV